MNCTIICQNGLDERSEVKPSFADEIFYFNSNSMIVLTLK